MKIGFFEVEKWASSLIEKVFPQALRSKDILDGSNVSEYKDLQVLSTFCFSTLSRQVLEKMPRLKYIATRSTGFNHIDLKYCSKKGIIASNIPVYGRRTVTEHTFGLILMLTRKLYDSVHRTKEEGIFSVIGLRGTDLFGKKIGIIGMGHIGLEVVKIARAFGMTVLVYTRTHKQELADEYGFKYVELNELLAHSDVITLHLPLNKHTHHIINKDNIAKIKRGAYLINAARGGLIETEALIIGLEKGILEGVGLDVLEEELAFKEEAELLSSEFRKKVNYENLVLDNILLKHPKVIVTPHNAFNSIEALRRILNTTFENIQSFIDGSPQNVIDIPNK